MSKITLSSNEYRNIFELASTFKGDSSIKLSALRIMEKISQTANTASTKGEDDASVLPEKITVDFTTNELEGFWKGLVGYINDTAVTVDKVLIIKALAASMKMSKRFTKLEETITVSEDETPLDE